MSKLKYPVMAMVSITWLFFTMKLHAQTTDTTKKFTLDDSSTRPHPFQYDKDSGLQYKNGDFTLTTWAYAEGLFSPGDYSAFRRVRQGMEFRLPAYNFRISGNRYRTVLFYEVDFTDNKFFQATKRFKDWENLFIAFQNADDPNKFRILFGENTHVFSREDNLSSGNLVTINRSLILEEHGSVNNFGTQWGLQIQKQINPTVFLQFAMQDNRGSMNTDTPRYQFWKDIAIKVTKTFIQPTDKSPERLNVGVAIDRTTDITNRSFVLVSAINQVSLGSTPATGNKFSFENNLDYTNKLGKHLYTFEYETIYSRYSDQGLNVAGGYAMLQFQLFDEENTGDLVPFVRYDLVNLSNRVSAATEQAVRLGINYNLPFTHKLVNFHVEYAKHLLNGSSQIISPGQQNFDEFRFEFRVNAARYLRF
ncbi:hypothetical protein [Mucilaginibacter flavidus]|uniref:hypothetical protein n=1 Tax=Mucilaginibacter flavidus TaxID=2949309 RepID=UPI0020937A9E|nr:hypothetical protein [Mucilaginibacter flavidus]MCO5946744.1 hypothetical protein [Mucilaginibacter flavidus]